MSRWWTFIVERFPPGSYLPLVAVFVVANLSMVQRPPRQACVVLLITPVVVLSYFLRLRCFDEIKDLDVDRQINPTRPLARGLIPVWEVKEVIVGLVLIELVLTGLLGMGPLVAHLLAVVYSVAMYNEFFLGRHLRQHLTLYAVTHTASCVLLGWSVAAQALGDPLWTLSSTVLWFGLVNWALFNVFEFGRKTFAPEEEREHVETYSLNFGPWGAVALTMSQVAVAWAVVSHIGPKEWPFQLWFTATSLLFAGVGVAYGLAPTVPRAERFRGGSSAYLVCFLAALAVRGLWR